MTTADQRNRGTSAAEGTPWRQIWIALALSLVGSGILGGAALFVLDNIWGIAIAGSLSLLGGGVYLGRSIGQSEPLYGTLLAALYVGLAVIVAFGGTAMAVLPDPLPGLAIGDSTFYFVSPLLALAAGVAGSVLGGQMAGRGADSN